MAKRTRPIDLRLAMIVACTASASLAVILVLASPWILRWALGPGATWADVGNVGQAYGGAAAVLGALALLGIVVTAALQWRSVVLQRAAIARERHFELVRLGFDHNDFLALGSAGPNTQHIRLTRYANLWLSYWFWSWSEGLLDERALRRCLEDELFVDDAIFEWWAARIRTGGWGASKRHARFTAIVNAEYHRLSEARRAEDTHSAPH